MKLTCIVAGISCSLVLLSACAKNDNNSPTKQKLQAGMWQIVGETITMKYMGKDSIEDSYSHWRACEQDDLILFEGEGNGTTDENTNRCPEDAQTAHFTWELQSNETQLKIAIGGREYMADITELSDTQLVLKSVENDSTTGPVTYIDTYKNIK